MEIGGRVNESGFLEREEVTDALAAAAAAAADGAGQLIAVQGPAGIGKTRLLGELARLPALQPMTVLTARGATLERDFSFGVTRQLFDTLIARATPAQRRTMFAGAAELSRPLFDAIEQAPDPTGFVTLNALWWLLSNLALDRPVALLVDDAHWADAPSLRWLSFLGPRIAEVPVLAIVAGRTDEPGAPPEWPGLASPPQHRIELPPLSAPAIGELLADRLESPPEPEFVTAAHAATGGNPFFATELARELTARGVRPTGAEAAAVSQVAPDTISAHVLTRLDAEPDPVGRVARALAILGDDVPLLQAAELAELDEAATRAAAVRLAELGILRRTGAPAFVHPIVREAVYAGIEPVLRSALHHRAGALLEARGEAPERQAVHLLQTDSRADSRVVERLREAAAAALSRGAPAAAAVYLRRALDEPPAERELPLASAELGEALLALGDLSALEPLRRAASIGDQAIIVRASSAVVRLLMLTGDVDAAIEAADAAAQQLGDGSERLAIETELVCVAALSGAETWARLSDRLRSLTAEAGTSGGTGRPLLALASYDEFRRGRDYAAAVRLALAAFEGDELPDRGAEDPLFLIGLWSLVRSGYPERTLPLLDRATTLARERGSLLGFGFASNARGMALVALSDLNSAEAELRLALAAARDNGWTALEWQALGMYLLALAERGDLEVGQAELERSGATGELPRLPLATGLLVGRANLRYAQGQWEEAYEDFVECGRSEGPYSDRSQIVWWRPDAAMALAHLGRNDEALALAETEVEIQREWGDPISVGRAWHARGLALGDRGIEDLERAVATLDGVYDTGLAACLVDLGATLRRMGHRSDARPPLRRAREIALRIGSRRYSEAARVELAAAGARPRSVVRQGVHALTPSEHRIARLAAEGRSNPEIAQHLFITRKTVETHLGHIYAKLDIARREQLNTALGPLDKFRVLPDANTHPT